MRRVLLVIAFSVAACGDRESVEVEPPEVAQIRVRGLTCDLGAGSPLTIAAGQFGETVESHDTHDSKDWVETWWPGVGTTIFYNAHDTQGTRTAVVRTSSGIGLVIRDGDMTEVYAPCTIPPG